MEPNNYEQGGAASSNPAADLQALLHALRLGDPSSSLQPLHPAATSSLPLNPQQVLAPPLPPMFQSPPQVFAPPPPHMFQSPTQVLAARTATPDMWLLPMYAPNPSAATTPSRLSAGAEEYRRSSVRFSLPHLSEVQSPPTLGNGSGSLHPYTPALLRALSADADRPPTTREEVRAHLLHGSTERYLVMSPVSSAHVVDLLVEGDATMRRCVIACVRPIVHKVMNKRYPVFHALLNACNGRVNELEDIIGAVCNGKGFLMQFDGREDNKWKALKELIRVVAWNRSLCKTLIHGLIRKEHLMVEREGPAVLRHCFTTLPYEDCSVIFEDTLGAIDEMITSQFGWQCMAVHLENGERKKRRSRGDHLDADQRIRHALQMELLLPAACPPVRQRAVQGAHRGSRGAGCRGAVRGQVRLLRGGGVLLEPLDGATARARRVSGPARRRSRGGGARPVLQLRHQDAARGGQGPPPVRATELARRIEALPEVVRNHGGAKRVMEIIKKLFSAQPIQ